MQNDFIEFELKMGKNRVTKHWIRSSPNESIMKGGVSLARRRKREKKN